MEKSNYCYFLGQFGKSICENFSGFSAKSLKVWDRSNK